MLSKILPEERELLLELKEGNEAAFEQIYKFYSPRLYGNLIKLLKSEPIAAEILQDSFVKIWELRETIDVDKSFRSYLFRISENKVYDRFRKIASYKKFATLVLNGSAEEYSHVEEGLTQKETRKVLEGLVNALPQQRRRVFMLCKIEGKSYKQASKILGISTSTISDHILKANDFLRNRMARY